MQCPDVVSWWLTRRLDRPNMSLNLLKYQDDFRLELPPRFLAEHPLIPLESRTSRINGLSRSRRGPLERVWKQRRHELSISTNSLDCPDGVCSRTRLASLLWLLYFCTALERHSCTGPTRRDEVRGAGMRCRDKVLVPGIRCWRRDEVQG